MIHWPIGRYAALGVSIAVLATASAAPAQPIGNSRARVGQRLAEALRNPVSAEGIAIRVTLKPRRASVHARQDRALGAMAPGTFQMKYRFESVSGFAGRAQASAINALLRHPEVSAIHLDYEVHGTLAQGVALIGADAAHSSGITGSGVNVAVLDSGIDTDHPDLSDDIIAEQCFCNDHPSPNRGCCPAGGMQQSGTGSAEDDNGHGTHVAGIITSAGAVAAPGVAPDAGIVAIKVLSATGSGFSSSIDAAFDWLVTNHQALGVRVVNASLGDGGEYNNPLASPCSGTPGANAVSLLHAAGVAVFAASGNDGHDDGISEPACIAEAISVGGVYDALAVSAGAGTAAARRSYAAMQRARTYSSVTRTATKSSTCSHPIGERPVPPWAVESTSSGERPLRAPTRRDRPHYCSRMIRAFSPRASETCSGRTARSSRTRKTAFRSRDRM